MSDKIREIEIQMLRQTTEDLVPLLEQDLSISHVRKCAYNYYSPQNREYFQVQITVTRDESDFLDAFDIEEMSSY